jgi:hypothetical protein
MPPEFAIRSDAVDVGQIMQQIRARIREKRGVDYTEEEILQLAHVKLEKFLDPTRVRSDLVQQYRRAQDPGKVSTLEPPPENYAFEDYLVYGSARGLGGRLITGIRKLLNPVLKLFINPNPIIHVLHRQSAINTHNEKQFERIERVRTDLAGLNYEVMHNLVVEMTRLSIEVKNLKMRIESVSSRLDFSDRRARALESVVQYRPGTGPAVEEAVAPAPSQGAAPAQTGRRDGDTSAAGGPIKGEAQRARRKRRRRGRGSPNAQPGPGGGGPSRPEDARPQEPGPAGQEPASGSETGGDSLPFERDAAQAPETSVPPADREPTDQ